MRRKIVVCLLLMCIIGAVLAESGSLLEYFTKIDWFSMESAENAPVPEGLTEREAEIYRAGYANGHYAALNPAYIEGLFVINTKTKTFHLSNCMETLRINTENRKHSYDTAEAISKQGFRPCGSCNPQR
ncbi:MAG: hypothetical protein IJL87_04655 [Clostridia bacterium]|nr:hypothetical protein [Clostridia bacterium]